MRGQLGFDVVDVVAEATPVAPTVVRERVEPEASGDLTLAVREVLGFGLRLFPALPLPTTLLCMRADHDGVPSCGARLVVLTTSRAAYVAAVARRLPTFIGGEFEWLALAAEHERARPIDVEHWCDRKVGSGNQWRLAADVVLAGATGALPPLGWRTGQVLQALGLDLVAVGDELPEGW